MILAISHPGDEHTRDVVSRVRARGRRLLEIDLAAFPAMPLAATWLAGEAVRVGLEVDGHQVPLDTVRAVWWRRVSPWTVPPAVTAASDRAFVQSETAAAVLGTLDSLDASWVNPRTADAAAHHKPLQWTHARRVGLDTPDTLVTSHPQQARAFIAAHGLGRVVYKAFLAAVDSWRETRLLARTDLARLDALRLAPVILQEYVPGVDIRATVVGDRVFAASIDATGTSYPIDMRMVLDECAVRPMDLDDALRLALINLISRLGLRFGSVDLRRRPDGATFFLEVNPAGQWLFVEGRTGQPISQAVADLLAGLDAGDDD